MHAKKLTAGPLVGASVPDTDLDLLEMANLSSKDTGVDGIIYISTAQGSHGPRLKWYPGRPRRDAACLSVTIADAPQVINNGLPGHTASAAAPDVVAWIGLNRTKLCGFWDEGETWTRDEVNAFIDGLEKLAP